MRWWHKWIGIAIGFVLLIWVVSGIAMMAPMSAVVWGAGVVEPTLDLSAATVTPADAVAAALQRTGDTAVGIRSVTLRPLVGTVVYLVTPVRGDPLLIDARSGAPVTITTERAEEIASGGDSGVAAAAIERITTAPIGYGGRLPAWRVSYDDAAGTVAIVAEATGDVVRTERRDRMVMRAGHYLHVFVPLKQLPGGDRTRKAALVVTGIIALLSLASGYWLALPARMRRRQRPPK